MTKTQVDERRKKYLPHLKKVYGMDSMSRQEEQKIEETLQRLMRQRMQISRNLIENESALSWKEQNDLMDMFDWCNMSINLLTSTIAPEESVPTNQGLTAEIDKDTKTVIYDAKAPITEKDINEVNQALQDHDRKKRDNSIQ